MSMLARSLCAAILLGTPAVANAQEAKADAKKPARASIYDQTADARAQVEAATARARSKDQRVLVMFGGDWCGWCHKLHELFGADPEIRAVLHEEYVLVMVDTVAPHAEALLKECEGDLTGVGYPFLAVLDVDGKVLTRQKTDPLEEGDHHSPAKVKAFLDAWAPPKRSAGKALREGLARASSEDKRLFVHFGTPYCGWCDELDAFLARPDMAPIFGREFVDVLLDLTRMAGAREVLEKYQPKTSIGGVPWFAVLDAKGQALATSDGPKGNIGYPAAPSEIAYFVETLRKSTRKIEPAQVDAIEAALKEQAAKIEAKYKISLRDLDNRPAPAATPEPPK